MKEDGIQESAFLLSLEKETSVIYFPAVEHSSSQKEWLH